jgi:hypothetical protein
MKFRVRRLDGSWIWMWSRATPKVGKSGEAARWYGVLEDIDDETKNVHSLREFKHRCIGLGYSPDAEPDCPLQKAAVCTWQPDASAFTLSQSIST